MNDNDIINAIAGCVNSSTKCNECIFIDEVCDGEDCKEIALRYAIDIISRQKATIKDLIANTNGIYERSIPAPMPMAQWLREELTEHVYNRCMEEL